MFFSPTTSVGIPLRDRAATHLNGAVGVPGGDET